MAISYNKLWKQLIDKKMSAANLRKKANIVCGILERDFGDIIEYIPEKEK